MSSSINDRNYQVYQEDSEGNTCLRVKLSPESILGTNSGFELDANNDLMPVTGTFTVVYWNLDADDNLMPIN